MTYERLRPLGRGGSAEVWLARDPAGRLVALKVTADAGPALAAAALRHPNVLGVLATDGDLLVLPYVPGGSLAAALAAGARYAAPQAAALGAALADALANAHAAGLVHGDVKAGNVLLEGPGTPLLADFLGEGTPEGDVRDLARLLTALAPDLASTVHGTPTATALRDALRAADLPVRGDDPEPTRGFGTPPPAPPPGSAARAPRPRGLAGAARSPLRVASVAALAVLLAVLAGWSLPTRSSAGALPAAPDWAQTLTALDAARSAAFARADARGLDAVYVPGSAPHRSDTALLTTHARRGERVADLHLVVVTATATATGPDEATLDVTDRLQPYTVVDRAGRVVRRWPGRGEERWRITLRRTGTTWRIAAVTLLG